jgi:hypothetical protein
MRANTRPSTRNHHKPHPPQRTSTAIRQLQLEVARAEALAAKARAEARWRISAIARDLLGTAAKFARKGRPRLLAVLSKIIGDDKLRGHK